MTNAEVNRAMRNAGKAFLAARLEDLVERRNELDDPVKFELLVDSYFRKQVGHHDTNAEETRERILIAKEVIEEERYLDCLEILAETKSLKPEFRQKAKSSLKKLS